MLKENRELQGFVFFTNVDLTPSQHADLKDYVISLGVAHVDLFDFERLRHVLDSPQGLIARLQYLGIPMSATEQIALVDKYGRELQRVVTTRLDRVERTLSDMKHFMAFQKPIFRIEVYIDLVEPMSSDDLGDQALAIYIVGLRGHNDGLHLFCQNDPSHARSLSALVFRLTTWIEDARPHGHHSIIQHSPTPSQTPDRGMAVGWFPLLRVGSQFVRLIDLMFLRLEAICTMKIHSKVKRVAIDVNGYELFSCIPNAPPDAGKPVPRLPQELPFNATGYEWVWLVLTAHRDCFFDPPRPSGRLLPLTLEMKRNTPGSPDVLKSPSDIHRRRRRE